jgi:hypothetical protein
MLSEDLTLFFADFAVPASWTPANGSPAQTAQVILDQPDDDIFGSGEISRAWSITYQATEFVGLKTSETISVNGAYYKVREVKALDDGAVMNAKLSKF